MADCEAVFSRDVSVSQPIMICLLQQLGAVLVPAMDPEDIKTILKWLQEIAVTIDPSNINIKRRKFFCMMLDLVSLSV
jgi:enhancer of mRNA-decapping protein 4